MNKLIKLLNHIQKNFFSILNHIQKNFFFNLGRGKIKK